MNQVTPVATNGVALTTDPPEPVVFSVLTVTGQEWTRKGMVPRLRQPQSGATPQAVLEFEAAQAPFDAMKITRMVHMPDGSVKVFAFPLPSSDLDKAQTGIQYTIPAAMVLSVSVLARFDVLQKMEADTVSEASGEAEEEARLEEREECAQIAHEFLSAQSQPALADKLAKLIIEGEDEPAPQAQANGVAS